MILSKKRLQLVDTVARLTPTRFGGGREVGVNRFHEDPQVRELPDTDPQIREFSTVES